MHDIMLFFIKDQERLDNFTYGPWEWVPALQKIRKVTSPEFNNAHIYIGYDIALVAENVIISCMSPIPPYSPYPLSLSYSAPFQPPMM